MTTREKVQSLIDSGKTCTEAVTKLTDIKKTTVQWYYSQLTKGKAAKVVKAVKPAKPTKAVKAVKAVKPTAVKKDKSMTAKQAITTVFNQGLTLKQAIEILPEINQATVKKVYSTLKKKDNGK